MQTANTAAIEEIFHLARRADHRSLRTRLHDDASWHPAREGGWSPCTTADDVVLGAKGFIPRLFQIVVLREGKVVSMRDYSSREDALAAAGIRK